MDGLIDGLMVLDGAERRHTTSLASRDHGGTGPSSAGPSLEPQTGPPLRGAPIMVRVQTRTPGYGNRRCKRGVDMWLWLWTV